VRQLRGVLSATHAAFLPSDDSVVTCDKVSKGWGRGLGVEGFGVERVG